MRICSLLPSATEIVCALGLADQLVAISHECDYPPEIRSRPVITSSRVETAGLSSREIDLLVSAKLHDHDGIYALDEQLLEQLNPDLILTQELCDVCAVSYEQVQTAVRALRGNRTVLSLEPTDLDGVLSTITTLGEATGRLVQAEALVADLRVRLGAVAGRTPAQAPRPRVVCLEWLDPPFTGGHWIPEMVRLAGGEDVLSAPGQRSRRLDWKDVLDASPDVLVLMPCGFGVERALVEYGRASLPGDWWGMPAVRTGELYAVDANAYFSRPGPRLVEGTEILQQVISSDTDDGGLGPGWRRATRKE
jgi:iron complex transport system substrate-binding protein